MGKQWGSWCSNGGGGGQTNIFDRVHWLISTRLLAEALDICGERCQSPVAAPLPRAAEERFQLGRLADIPNLEGLNVRCIGPSCPKGSWVVRPGSRYTKLVGFMSACMGGDCPGCAATDLHARAQSLFLHPGSDSSSCTVMSAVVLDVSQQCQQAPLVCITWAEVSEASAFLCFNCRSSWSSACGLPKIP